MFAEILEKIVEEVPSGIGAILMGYDGIPIDQYVKPAGGIDLNRLAIEYAAVLKEIKNAVNILQAGELEEVLVVTSNSEILTRALTPEYFVALIMERQGDAGKGRYLLLREASRLREELS